MNTLSVLIITNEPIFSFGLRVQFRRWGFNWIELAEDCEFGLQIISKQLPALVIMDEKYLETEGCSGLEFITNLMATPLVLLCAEQKKGYFKGKATSRKENTGYTCLHKPCPVDDLKAVVERLLHIQVMEV